MIRWLRAGSRFLTELARAQHRDKLHLHATALAYTTLFSFVPLLTVALVTVGRVQPERAALVVRAIATVFPFSPTRVQATLAAFAERTASLGWLAIVISVLVIFNAFYQIEEVVNTIWGIPRRRPWQVRLLSFATILVCGPLLLGALFSALYWLSSRPWYPSIVWLARPLPALLAMLALGTLYRWVPHTRVPWRAAWIGAAVAACGLTLLHLGFQTYLDLASDLNVIYGSLALVLFFLMSLYLFWLALLLGAEASWVVGHAPPPHPESAAAVLDLLVELQSAQSLPAQVVAEAARRGQRRGAGEVVEPSAAGAPHGRGIPPGTGSRVHHARRDARPGRRPRRPRTERPHPGQSSRSTSRPRRNPRWRRPPPSTPMRDPSPHFSPDFYCERGYGRPGGRTQGSLPAAYCRVRLGLSPFRAPTMTAICALSSRTPVRNAG